MGLFNAHDWDGLRRLVGEECRLDLVAKAARQGPGVQQYFAQYAKAPPVLKLGFVEDRPALLAYPGAGATPSYFVLLEWEHDRLALIRDFRYVLYVAADLEYALVP
jgi:hypothetical protein